MYGKLFVQMYDGTLGTKGPWEALVTFQQLIILADQEGVVDMTPEALARRTTIPLDVITIGLQRLIEPDPDSRTPGEEGRRIVPLNPDRTWGWRIVNYKHYRSIRTAEDRREYHRNYWREKRSPNRHLNPDSTDSTESTKPTNSIGISRSRGKSRSKDDDGENNTNTAAALLPVDYQTDYTHLRRSVASPESLDIELRTLLAGSHPRAEGASPEDVGRGLRELTLSGRPPNSLANFVRIAMKNRLEPSTNGVPPDEWEQAAARLKAKNDAKRGTT